MGSDPHRDSPAGQPSEPEQRDRGRLPEPMRVMGIGASAGGLAALRTLFASMPEQTGVCFVVVMHLSADHESHLAALLQAHSRLPVQQVTGTTALEPDHVYVIPPGANIDAIDTHLTLSELEPQRQARAPIDHFFRTLADAQQDRAVGLVLTGTGADGTLGLRRIRERGGLAIVQSPEEAEYDAMPRSAIAAGVADLVLPLAQIPEHLLQVGRALPEAAASETGPLSEQAEGVLQKILAQIRATTGHDFTQYKRSTILRRIRRRMQLHRVQQLDAYLGLLRKQDQEVASLSDDLLITVTEFFRDAEVFEHLEAQIIPRLFDGKGATDQVRVWSVGCATGEEAYSLAMLLLEEEARREVRPRQVQVFATDLHEPALRKAREGNYPESIAGSVSPERLERFFDKENGYYRIRKQVREHIVFAVHNIPTDPPFSRMQMISCRNLLIYLQRDVQKHLMALFHYALEKDGYLLVGTAEAIDSDLFVCEDKKAGLYRRRNVPGRRTPWSQYTQPGHTPSEQSPAPQAEPPASYGAMHELIVEQYAPPSVLINPDGEVVHYSARAGRYLQMPGGTPTGSIYRLVAEPLRVELRVAVHAARDRKAGYRSRPVPVSIEGESRSVIVRVEPVDQPQTQGFLLVMFDELEDADMAAADASQAADADVRQLEAELEQTKRRMQSLIEEHDASQERMQAYNEELVSTNEELRSTMEELETSKEEMESMNEELTTVNQENLQKVEELDQLSSDLHNLLNATHIATVFLDRDMRILRLTSGMTESFGIREIDRGRSLDEFTDRIGYEPFREDFACVLDRLAPVEREVGGERDRFYSARLQPYRSADDHIQGVILTFIDITERKHAENKIRESRELAEKIIDTVRNPMLVLNEDLRVQSANEAFYDRFRMRPADLEGECIFDLHEGQWDNGRLRELLKKVLPEDRAVEDFELEHRFEDGQDRSLLLNARRVDHIQLILLAIEDITQQKQARESLERSHDEQERLVAERTAQLERQTVRLRRLVGELASAEQRERARIAAVLHDELQQVLVGAKMRLGMARSQTREEALVSVLEQTLVNLDEAIDATRSLVRQAGSHALAEQGLISALRWLGEEMERRHGLAVSVDAEGPEPPLGEELRVLLFESIREMLFNVVKHANVDEAIVAVEQDGERLYVTVSDEGAGFAVEQWVGRDDQTDFGLFSRGDRLEALGGSCSVDSAPAQGTRIHLSLPIDAVPTG